MAERLALRSIERRVRLPESCNDMICDKWVFNGLRRTISSAASGGIPTALGWRRSVYRVMGLGSEEREAI